jgi:Ca2+-binding EF-hand superfamily protein
MKHFVLAAALVIAATPALARGPEDRKKFDPDGDGRIAVADLDAEHKARMAAADVDGDGYITQDEMKAQMEKRREEMRAKMFPDANGDGSVDIGEFRAGADARFKELDANKDGQLTEEEARAGHKRRGGRR